MATFLLDRLRTQTSFGDIRIQVSVSMEGLDKDAVLLHSFRSEPSESFATDVTSNSEQEEQHPPKTKQDTPELRASPPALGPIEFRMQQLHNRRFLLQKIQQCIKKEQNGGGTTEEITKDGEEHCELEAIQKELEELEVKKEELMKKEGGSKSKAKTGQQDLALYKETPRGGIYMLPPLQPEQRGGVVPATAEIAAHTIVPAEELGQAGGVTKCPRCEGVVITETHSKVGETVWIACFLSIMMGCVAGCCLIPFFIKRLRSVHHRCPMCQTHIHTHHPF